MLIGFFMSLYNFWLIVKAKSTENWDETTGVILSSKLIDYTSVGETDSTFKPTIEYSYIINGKEYKSRRIYFGSHIMHSYNKRKSGKTVEKYFKGKEVVVYFNRFNEKQSVLEKGIKYQIVTGFLLGIIFLGIGLAFLHNPNLVNIC